RDLRILAGLLPFLREYRGRVLLALASLALAKLAGVGVPLVLKEIIDALDTERAAALVLPLGLLLGYGALRLSSSMFNELRDSVFARVRYRVMRRISIRVLEHLHALSLRFHLERNTGAISRDIERGTRSVSILLNYLVFNILPTLFEFVLVSAILLGKYPAGFAGAVLVTVGVYVTFTLLITEWRMHYRLRMNSLDSHANSQAIDGLINYETVKYFGNDRFEVSRYDGSLSEWEDAAVKSQTSMSLLNFGQGAIIALGVTVVMVMAGQGVVAGALSLGDLVLVNTMMLQLFMPLGFLGVVYRQIKHTLVDMGQMFDLLERTPEVRDAPDAGELGLAHAPEVRFDRVSFAYQPERPILREVDFAIAPGTKVAVVGPSGAGKSTLARLLFRFYEVGSGAIRVDGRDIAGVTQESLRRAIGIVPQDTVLFNDTILYNIAYARPEASREEVEQAARLAHIHDFIAGLPQGYDTVVGERGLKLSGGEKQRVAIARVILKNPPILVFDEATSSLDSRSEKAIQTSLAEVAENHTTLVIAHRLSTIVDADAILVMDQGRVVERGTHADLLAADGIYARLWALQQAESREPRLPPTAAVPEPAE
ncbi:MAG: ABC transporter ATP-binding protein/permease, partial [Gammaproteobacteria bacterium]|nr:ABC transporter ATP-binding protein/permease [Gammaproteobacteria bacterium]